MKRATIFTSTISLILTMMVMSGCSYMFVRKNVNIITDNDAEIYKNGALEGTSNIRLNVKDKKLVALEIKKEGYKTTNALIHASEFNPGTVVSLAAAVTAGVLAGPVAGWGVCELFGYHKTYKKNHEFKLTPLPDLGDANLSLNFARVKFDFEEGATTLLAYKNYKKRQARSDGEVISDEFEYNEAKVLRRMDAFLSEMGVYNEKELRFGSYHELTIFAEIENYTKMVTGLYRNPNMSEIEMTVHFQVKDLQNRIIIDTTVSALSGQFLNSTPNGYIFYDAFEYATIDLLNHPKLLPALKREKVTRKKMDDALATQLKKGKGNLNVGNMEKHVFKMNTAFGTATLFPVGSDGLLACSHRSFDFNDSMKIEDSEGNVFEAVFVEGNLSNDMVILKIDKIFESYFSVNVSDELPVGTQLWVCGFEDYYDAFLVTHGTINSHRDHHGQRLYQIDNECSSLFFPPVFDNSGNLIGFITRNLSSSSVSGISFCSMIR